MTPPDSNLSALDVDEQVWRSVKLVDNGDGTFRIGTHALVADARVPFVVVRSTTVAGGKITQTVAAAAGKRHTLRSLVGKSDLAGTITIKSGTTTLAVYDTASSSEKALDGMSWTTSVGEALVVEITATTSGALSIAGDTA